MKISLSILQFHLQPHNEYKKNYGHITTDHSHILSHN